MLAAAGPAQAATVSMKRVRVVEEGLVFHERSVTLAAPGGEVNRLTVRMRLSEDSQTGSVLFSDARRRIRAGAGCRRARGGVACSSATDSIEELRVDTGPGDDVVRIVSRQPTGPTTTVAAGPGDDVVTGSPTEEIIRGGAGDDVLHGGPSIAGWVDRDELSGGPGRDELRTRDGDLLEDGERDGRASSDLYVGDDDAMLSYASRRRPVSVDLARGGGGGGAGERDRIVGVGSVGGGAGDDRLAGRNGREFLSGLAGDDVLLGRGGADLLRGGPGADRLDGGAGRDAFSDGADGAADRHACGPDHDEVQGQDPFDLLSRDCERAGWGLDDLMAAQPAFAGRTATFSASCGGSSPCTGTVELRTPPGNELVGQGSFRFERAGRIQAVLGGDPAALFAPPGRRVTVLVTYEGCGECPKTTGFTTTFRR